MRNFLTFAVILLSLVHIRKSEQFDGDSFCFVFEIELASILQQEVRLVVGVRKEVLKLTSTLQGLLVDAEARQVKEEVVKVWPEKLKDVSYKIDDDEWGTAILNLQEGIPKNKVVVVRIWKIRPQAGGLPSFTCFCPSSFSCNEHGHGNCLLNGACECENGYSDAVWTTKPRSPSELPTTSDGDQNAPQLITLLLGYVLAIPHNLMSILSLFEDLRLRAIDGFKRGRNFLKSSRSLWFWLIIYYLSCIALLLCYSQTDLFKANITTINLGMLIVGIIMIYLPYEVNRLHCYKWCFISYYRRHYSRYFGTSAGQVGDFGLFLLGVILSEVILPEYTQMGKSIWGYWCLISLTVASMSMTHVFQMIHRDMGSAFFLGHATAIGFDVFSTFGKVLVVLLDAMLYMLLWIFEPEEEVQDFDLEMSTSQPVRRWASWHPRSQPN